jgi:hypothetical protein
MELDRANRRDRSWLWMFVKVADATQPMVVCRRFGDE